MRVKFETIKEAEAALHPFYEVVLATSGKDITLGRTERLMAHIGNPEKRLRVVHIAGTSGKTSTTYYIAALIRASGQKVGHTVSPHIISITERVQINGAPLTDRQFCDYLAEFLALIDDAPETPSWFECLIAFAYWVFDKEGVDYAVMETGLGGLQDSTNVAARVDKLCVITDIGFDHMQVLGNRLGAIAHQKAGIIHDGNTALMYQQAEEIMQVVRYWVSQQEDAELLTFDQARLADAYGGAFRADLPVYQQRNWLLAFAAYRFLANRDGLKLLSQSELTMTQAAHVPGRMERVQIDCKTILMDGAHNEQKMQAFVESYEQLYPGRKVPVLLAVKEGKDIDSIAPLIARIASTVVVTKFDRGQDMPDIAMEPALLVEKLQADGVAHVAAIDDADVAYKEFIKTVDDLGVVTGSFFLVSQLKRP